MPIFSRNHFPPVPAGTVIKGWGSPYALIVRGGGPTGRRPPTTLALIVSASSPDGGRTLKMKALIRRGDGWTKPRPLEWADIVASWRTLPHPDTIAKARRRAIGGAAR